MSASDPYDDEQIDHAIRHRTIVSGYQVRIPACSVLLTSLPWDLSIRVRFEELLATGLLSLATIMAASPREVGDLGKGEGSSRLQSKRPASRR